MINVVDDRMQEEEEEEEEEEEVEEMDELNRIINTWQTKVIFPLIDSPTSIHALGFPT